MYTEADVLDALFYAILDAEDPETITRLASFTEEDALAELVADLNADDALEAVAECDGEPCDKPASPFSESLAEAGGTCKPGQRSDLTGCVPASGEGGTKPRHSEEEITRADQRRVEQRVADLNRHHGPGTATTERPTESFVPRASSTSLVGDDLGTVVIEPAFLRKRGEPVTDTLRISGTRSNRHVLIEPDEPDDKLRLKIRYAIGLKITPEEKAWVRADLKRRTEH